MIECKIESLAMFFGSVSVVYDTIATFSNMGDVGKHYLEALQ